MVTTKASLEINYEKAAAEATNKVKQDLATKKIERRLELGAGNRKTAKKRDTFSGKFRTRDRQKYEGQEQLQHLENGDWKTFRNHKDWGENHFNNHRPWPRGNKESKRTK